jgi:hypothetical protein
VVFPTVTAVIGLLRFVGLFNAAVWFGAAIFFTLSLEPFSTSQEMKELLGAKNSPYFSIVIGQLLATRYVHLFLACSLISLIHLAAEWLYFGKYPQRRWLGLVVGLWLGGVAQGYWTEPKLKQLHRLQFTRAEQRERELAAHSYGVWRQISQAINILLLLGLGTYLWRVANPPDATRFLNPTKFRS